MGKSWWEWRMSVFENKVAFITGGASGIGRALGYALARHGARVVLTDVNVAGLEAACETIAAGGGRGRWLALDVTDYGAFEQAVDDVYAEEGPIDYLFNNAGIALFGEVHAMTPDQWHRILAVNLHGVVHGVRAVYPRMVAQGRGHVINTASMVGLVPSAGATAYAMTKHAVVGLSESLRGEGVAHGVQVSAVCPGIIDTDLKNTVELLHLDREKMLSHPLARLTPVDRCARVILRGVRRNRSVITVTAHAKLVWWLYRLMPGFVASRLGHWALRISLRRFAVSAEGGGEPQAED